MTDPGPRHMVELLLKQAPPPGPEHACPYLPDRQARNAGFFAERLDPMVYTALMDQGFRRSGTLFYQPVCAGCRECVPIRIPVAAFRRSRSQRRVWKQNADVEVNISRPQLTEDKWRLFLRYLAHRHPGSMGDTYEDLQRFLYNSPVDTEEVSFFLRSRLIGVSIIDVSPQAVSSVYMFFDPDHAGRSLGTHSTLWEIEECRRRRVPYYYLGYYIAGCAKMSYKVRFGPHERLHHGRGWVSDAALR